ncbi:hypothetical protein BJ546DRAFT_953456 [Cryomyces antarcticus]
MAVHTELSSKSDFDSALATKGKYVLIYAYEGSISEKAEEYASKYTSTTESYSVDVSKQATAKEYFGIESVPTIVIYKDGKEVAKFDNMRDQARMNEMAEMLSKN